MALSRVVILLPSLLLSSCASREAVHSGGTDRELAERIDRLVETMLQSDDEAKETALLADAKGIFEREGIPSVARVGDAASYGFVLIQMMGQPSDFRTAFLMKLRAAAARREVPEDAMAFAEARLRQAEVDDRFRSRTASNSALRDEILRLLQADQAVREKEGFDAGKMLRADRETAAPLRAIFERHGVPTYELVGVEAAKGFVVMVQHQAPEFRQAVLPKLKANVDAGQGDAGMYAMVYDRTQRDQGKKQLYGEQLECTTGGRLSEAPIEDEPTVNLRRARLGLIRQELYGRLVRLHSPDLCGADSR